MRAPAKNIANSEFSTNVKNLCDFPKDFILIDYGITLNEDLIRFGDSKHESGKKLAKDILTLDNPPTALFTGNNLITLGALETIYEMNLKIPDDVALIGFDDMYWAISLNPPLTAVR